MIDDIIKKYEERLIDKSISSYTEDGLVSQRDLELLKQVIQDLYKIKNAILNKSISNINY